MQGLLRSQDAEPQRKGLWDLYTKRCGPGDETTYQAYDRLVTQKSIEWIRQHANDAKPWALCIHYVSAHAPYTVPRDLLELYPIDKIELPATFSPEKRPQHPALSHLREILAHDPSIDPELIKLLTASYYAAITYLDREVGQVLDCVDALDLRDKTRVAYTADHGYSSGNHFIVGLFNLYEHSVGVPLIMAGPDIKADHKVAQQTSHVDLFPTILDSFTVPMLQEDSSRGFIVVASASRNRRPGAPGICRISRFGFSYGKLPVPQARRQVALSRWHASADVRPRRRPR